MMSASWSVHMYDSIKLFNPFLFIYFIGFYIIVVIIILNLFLAVILDAYNVQESSQQKVQLEIKTDERKGHEQTEVVTVSKANVKWKRELLRGDLPELANKELMELNRDSGVDLLKLMKEKEDKKDEKKRISSNVSITCYIIWCYVCS